MNNLNYELQILVLDYIINKVDEFGKFDASLILQELEIKKLYPEITILDELLFNEEYRDLTPHFIERKGCIAQIHGLDHYYELPDLGREVKRHRGYKNYLSFLSKRDNAIFENLHWTKRTAEATEESTGHNRDTKVLIAIYTAITFIIMVISIFTCCYSKK